MTDRQAEVETAKPLFRARFLGAVKRLKGPIAAIAAVGAILSGLLGYWNTYRAVTAGATSAISETVVGNQAVTAYGPDDRRMTFAVLPFEVADTDAQARQIADACSDQLWSSLEDNHLWATTSARNQVAGIGAARAGYRAIAKDLNVHFLLRGNIARNAKGYGLGIAMIDGASERVLNTIQLEIGEKSPRPEDLRNIENASYRLLFNALVEEVRRAEKKPVADLDVRDLTFRAYAIWSQRDDNDGEKIYQTTNDLLHRALQKSPHDLLAIKATAQVNLCDCVLGWTKNPEQQLAIGTEAVETYLNIDPQDVGMLLLRAGIYFLHNRLDDSLIVLDDLLQRQPSSFDVREWKAKVLLRQGHSREALAVTSSLMDEAGSDIPNSLLALAAAIHYSLGDYEKAATLARRAIARMSRQWLRNPTQGSIRLIEAAAEAQLGQSGHAAAVLADFRATVPQADRLSAIRRWIYPTADLSDFEPLFDGLRKAGVPD